MLTINNPTENDVKTIENDDTSYAIWQFEKGENGTEHIQALIYYKNPRVFPKKKYPRAHIEAVRDLTKSIQYCSKSETRIKGPYEKGEKPQQGRRKDLEAVGREILAGKDLYDIATENPDYYIRYYRGLTALKDLITEHRNGPAKVYWLWGLAGCGKTKYVHDNHRDVYIKDGTMWWDGYKQNEAICIDDFDGKWPYRDLLRLLDRYCYQGQVKGGYVKINSPYIYITCEYAPEHFWQYNELEQVTRRITEVRHIKKNPDDDWDIADGFTDDES